MKQAEKALRDAGWEEVARIDVEAGEEFYNLQTGVTCEAGFIAEGLPVRDFTVLRAPRPEPQYDPGVVARVRHIHYGDEFNALHRGDGIWSTEGEEAYMTEALEVLRVIAYPDGSIPVGEDEGDRMTRIDFTDETGRAYVNTKIRDAQFSFQDDGRTFKLFAGGTGSTPRPGDSFGQCTPDVDAINERMDARARELLERFWAKLDGKDDTE